MIKQENAPQVVANVTDTLRAFENSLDHTISLGGAMLAQLVLGRQELGLSAVFGQGVFDDAGAALGGLIEVRRAAVKTHRGCEAAGRYLRVNMGPPNEPKGPMPQWADPMAETDDNAVATAEPATPRLVRSGGNVA